MANEPIDCLIKLDASNSITRAPDTTNPTPPKKSGSASSRTAKNEKEKWNRLFREKIATLSPPLGQFFINMILQIAAFAAAIAFGVKSINIATTANEYSASANSYAARALEEARVSNQVAMLAVCLQSGDVQNNSFAAFCSRVFNGAPIVLPDAASNLFTRLSKATTSTATISSIARNTSCIKSTATAPEFYSTHSIQSTISSQPTQDPSRISSPPVCPVARGRYFLPGTTCPIPQVSSAPEAGDQLSRGPAQSSTGNNQRKTLAITLSLSLFFVTAIVVIIRLKLRPKRAGPAPSCVSEVNGNGEEQGHGDAQKDGVAQRYVEEKGEDQGGGDAQGYVEEQKKRNHAGDWWKTFRARFLDSTVSTNQE